MFKRREKRCRDDMKYFSVSSVILLGLWMAGCGNNASSITEINTTVDPEKQVVYESNNSLYNTRNLEAVSIDFSSTTPLNNRAAYITSQCYTKTKDSQNSVYNPCFACHTNGKIPNYINDVDVQVTRSMSEYSKTNRFTNLFKDRSSLVAQIGDEEIANYVKENNYIQKGTILLENRLKEVPQEWDVNKNGKWDGYMPDCYFNFDDEGFDISSNGSFTGWRAFGYYPFLGTFWPTNGSTDDVLVRLSSEFMQDSNRVFDLEVYKLNLSIVESLIKQKSISIDEVDESKYGVDLNQNGILDRADTIVFTGEQPSFDSATGKIANFSMSYVGLARELLISNEYLIAPGLYPKNTEFLHSVRYIDTDEKSESVKMAARMKELRYAKKTSWLSYPELSNAALADIKEKDTFPDRLRTIIGNTETGLLNHAGWVYQGFIEDAKGELRPQNYEETQYCIGCHSGIGATADSTFVFQRKFDKSAFQSGWYHWSQDAKGLKDIKEPKTEDGKDEYSLYLRANLVGDEFRTNDEVMDKFFEHKNTLIESQVEILKSDISYLLLPSIQRAIKLNKAYKVIVEEQSYIYGRDAHVEPLDNVHKELTIDEETGVTTPILYN